MIRLNKEEYKSVLPGSTGEVPTLHSLIILEHVKEGQ